MMKDKKPLTGLFCILTGKMEKTVEIEKKILSPAEILYTVSNGKLSFSAFNTGCTVKELFVDTGSKKVDVLLGFDSLKEWEEKSQYHNAVVGRVANRISGASFVLNGKKYILDKNDGNNCLHGGFSGYDRKIWDVHPFNEDKKAGLIFKRTSPDGEQGFPGNLTVEVKYSVFENVFSMEYSAVTDSPTPVNIINHGYFNLNGEGDVKSHFLQLDSSEYLEIDENLIPTGKILSVSSTPFDFRKGKKIGEDSSVFAGENGGYDHCYVTGGDEKSLKRVGVLMGEKSGIKMEIFTNQRGFQLYTGNFLKKVPQKNSKIQDRYSGVCIETQRFPDSVNRPEFPSSVLNPGQVYYSRTDFIFDWNDV